MSVFIYLHLRRDQVGDRHVRTRKALGVGWGAGWGWIGEREGERRGVGGLRGGCVGGGVRGGWNLGTVHGVCGMGMDATDASRKRFDARDARAATLW